MERSLIIGADEDDTVKRLERDHWVTVVAPSYQQNADWRNGCYRAGRAVPNVKLSVESGCLPGAGKTAATLSGYPTNEECSAGAVIFLRQPPRPDRSRSRAMAARCSGSRVRAVQHEDLAGDAVHGEANPCTLNWLRPRPVAMLEAETSVIKERLTPHHRDRKGSPKAQSIPWFCGCGLWVRVG